LPILLLIFAVGCIAVQELALYQTRPIRFSHAVHGEKADLSCDKCHEDTKSADGIGMPNPAKCRLCHNSKEEFESKLKPFLIDKKVVFTSVTAVGDEVKFAHDNHLKHNIACNECHTGIESSEAVSMDLRVDMKKCMTCHEERSAPTSCETCHKEIRAETQPASHTLNWQKAHGPMSRFHSDETQNNCQLCHTEASCNGCHQQTEPRGHTQFWKERGHGVSASIDREACETCHKTDSCDACHKETAPRSHTAAWMAPRDTHCLSCHEPLTRDNNSCLTCHNGTPSHQKATPKPGWHTPGMNCRACHGPGLGQPLPHVDNGDTCNSCHN
jgi:hypothetical protein